jgi:phosphoglycolate phosphatase-like HAD superfamily hydrolase
VYAILFDIDGTLVSTGGAGQLAFAETFAAEFGVEQLSGKVPFAGRSDRAIASELMRVHGVDPHEENWRRFRAGYLERLPSALARKQGRVLPGVVDLLREISAAGHPLVGLLTGNIREGAEHKLQHYGLAEHFTFGGFGDASADRNGIAAAALAEAQRVANAEFAEARGLEVCELAGAMVIGDTVHDVTCARSIGAFAVAVPTGGATREELAAAKPDLLLDDLSDARPLLAEIERALSA